MLEKENRPESCETSPAGSPLVLEPRWTTDRIIAAKPRLGQAPEVVPPGHAGIFSDLEKPAGARERGERNAIRLHPTGPCVR